MTTGQFFTGTRTQDKFKRLKNIKIAKVKVHLIKNLFSYCCVFINNCTSLFCCNCFQKANNKTVLSLIKVIVK